MIVGVPSPSGFPGVQLYDVYGAVPPAAADEAEPSQTPEQETLFTTKGFPNN